MNYKKFLFIFWIIFFVEAFLVCLIFLRFFKLFVILKPSQAQRKAPRRGQMILFLHKWIIEVKTSLTSFENLGREKLFLWRDQHAIVVVYQYILAHTQWPAYLYWACPAHHMFWLINELYKKVYNKNNINTVNYS